MSKERDPIKKAEYAVAQFQASWPHYTSSPSRRLVQQHYTSHYGLSIKGILKIVEEYILAPGGGKTREDKKGKDKTPRREISIST